MRRTSSRLAVLAAGLASVLTATLLVPGGPSPATAAAPQLRVTTVVGGLDQPWDVRQLPDGSLLVTERDRKRLLRVAGGRTQVVGFPSGSVWASGETGLLGLAVDPSFATNRRVYTCQGGYNSRVRGGHDVRVVSWVLAADHSRVTSPRVLVSGIPATSGRHGGCRLLVGPGGRLFVGTGDAALGTNPRNLRSLGGKVLRVDRATGRAVRGNPFFRAKNPAKRLIWTYGHRNVQGLAQRGSQVWSVEHGTSRDDEVNRLVRGGDFGWQPGPRYDESRPMTDQRLPGRQREARWRSGSSTIATSGATFVRGARWGDLEGTLAVAALKGSRVVFLRFDGRDRFRGGSVPAELRRFGRLRTVTQVAGGDLLVLTANGDGADRVLRVSPTG